MARHVLLNNVEHKNLRVITHRGAQYGENVGNVVGSGSSSAWKR